MDQCRHCTVKGNLPECLITECSQHESWLVVELKKLANNIITPDTDDEPCVVLDKVHHLYENC